MVILGGPFLCQAKFLTPAVGRRQRVVHCLFAGTAGTRYNNAQVTPNLVPAPMGGLRSADGDFI